MERITRRVSCLTLLKQNTFLDMHVHYILQLACKVVKNKGEYLIYFQEFYMSGCSFHAKTEVDIMWTNQHGTGLITSYLERTAGVLSTCKGVGNMKLAKGVPYEAHKISEGCDNKRQYVLLNRPPEVIYAPSTVVNHNGINMEGNFSSYK